MDSPQCADVSPTVIFLTFREKGRRLWARSWNVAALPGKKKKKMKKNIMGNSQAGILKVKVEESELKHYYYY